jgi:hypothetical protein
LVRLSPNIKKSLIDEIFSERPILDHPKHVSKHADTIPCDQYTHRLCVRSCDAGNQFDVRCSRVVWARARASYD